VVLWVNRILLEQKNGFLRCSAYFQIPPEETPDYGLNTRGVTSIYKMLLSHGGQVLPLFYKSQKCGEGGETLVTLLATAFYNTESWH
jgi:hypothetical protein